MPWGLSDAQMFQVMNIMNKGGDMTTSIRVIQNATLRQVYAEGKKKCENKEHSPFWPYAGIGRVSQPNRLGCLKCWEELRTEALGVEE